MPPPPKLTDDSICVTWATQQTKPFKSHAEDRVAFARAIEAARDQQWVEMLAGQEPVAKAWDEGYRAGINDERSSEANIGIAGFGAKVEPARNNPYRTLIHPHPDDTALLRKLHTDLEILKTAMRVGPPEYDWQDYGEMLDAAIEALKERLK